MIRKSRGSFTDPTWRELYHRSSAGDKKLARLNGTDIAIYGEDVRHILNRIDTNTHYEGSLEEVDGVITGYYISRMINKFHAARITLVRLDRVMSDKVPPKECAREILSGWMGGGAIW